MTVNPKFADAAISLPSLLPLQAAPQHESQVINYLQSLHNYLAQDRAKVVRALNVLSFYRLLMEDESEFPEAMGAGVLMVDTEADGLFYDADTGDLGGAEWRPIIPPFVKVTKEPTGFINTNQDSVLDIDTASWPTEVHVTIEPTGASFSFYVAGEKFTKTGQDHVQVSSTLGLHYIYYDSTGTLIHTTSATLEDIIRDNAFVAILYANGTSVQGLMDERHGLMPWQTHLWMHLTTGTIHRTGLGITNLDVDQNGSLDAHAECGGASGVIIDEDIPVSVGTLSVGADKWYTLHKVGAGGAWSYVERSFAPIIPSGTPIPAYNEWTGATWQLTPVSNNYYFLMHIFAAPFLTNGIGANVEQYVAICGEEQYLTKALAREGANTEISTIVTGDIPMAEFIPVGTIIYQYKNTMSNDYLAASVSTDTGEDYVSWIGAEITPGAPPSSHAHLTHRDDPNQHPADAIATDTAAFDGELSSADDEVQAALDTLDDHEHADGLGALNYIDFDTTYADGVAEGRLQWNIDDGTLEVGLPGGDVNLQIGEEMLIRCRNTTGVQIDNGSVVYQTGSSGNKPLIALADASTFATSLVVGVATEDIAHNANGYVTASGLVRDIDTAGMTSGNLLWLSTTAGEYTETRPEAPDLNVLVGAVIAVHATEGVIYARPINVHRLATLSDVYKGSAPADQEVPIWVNANSRFEFGNYDARYLRLTGGTLTGDLIIDKSGDATIDIDKGAANAGYLRFLTAGTDTWKLKNNASEILQIIDSVNSKSRLQITADGDLSLFLPATSGYVSILNQWGAEVSKFSDQWCNLKMNTSAPADGDMITKSIAFYSSGTTIYCKWKDYLGVTRTGAVATTS